MSRIARPLAALLLALPALAFAKPGDVRVLASVDGNPITTRDLDELLAAQPPPAPGMPLPSVTAEGVLRRLVENRLLEEEAFRIGADEAPEVKNQVWDLRRHRGMMALMDSVSATVEPPDAAFDVAMAQTSTMWRVYHIRSASEADSRALLGRLRAGASFAELAKAHSTDTTSAKRDGELGWAREDLYIPEFRNALTGLPKGELAGPVRTEDGWHILKLEDIRTETVGQSGAMQQQLKDAAMRERVMQKMSAFVDSLRKKYGVTVDTKKVATLDYGSADPAVQKYLREGKDVVATLPWKRITVADLTRQIRFQYFHGLEGRPEAQTARDKVLDEWIIELLLRHEAGERGYDRTPEVLAQADALRRELMREHVGKKILSEEFEPSEDELRRYHEQHRTEFTPPRRVRLDAVLLSDEAAAGRFRQQLEGGAKLKWLAGRTAEVADASPARFADWVKPEDLGLSAADLAPGRLVGPFPVEDAWAVASVSRLEDVQPLPLDKCRDQVIAAMKRERVRQLMTGAIDRLRAASRVDVANGATDIIAARLAEWRGGAR